MHYMVEPQLATQALSWLHWGHTGSRSLPLYECWFAAKWLDLINLLLNEERQTLMLLQIIQSRVGSLFLYLLPVCLEECLWNMDQLWGTLRWSSLSHFLFLFFCFNMAKCLIWIHGSAPVLVASGWTQWSKRSFPNYDSVFTPDFSMAFHFWSLDDRLDLLICSSSSNSHKTIDPQWKFYTEGHIISVCVHRTT